MKKLGNPCPSLPSIEIERDYRTVPAPKYIVLNNNTGSLFLDSIDMKTWFNFL